MRGAAHTMHLRTYLKTPRKALRTTLVVSTGLVTWFTALQSIQAQTAATNTILMPIPDFERQMGLGSIWEDGIGAGFRSTAQSVNLSLGANVGFPIFGGRQSHHLALSSLSYGHMLGSVFGHGCWYKGNLEFRGELFGGMEFSPETEWLIGLTPHLRYSFATGKRWVPFIDVGAGVTATSIGPPDLSDYFEFNLKGGAGVQWFIKENVALSFEAYYLHLSCAGMSDPNQGLNGVTGMVGLTVFF